MGKMRNEAHLRFPVFTLRSVQFKTFSYTKARVFMYKTGTGLVIDMLNSGNMCAQ